MKKLAIILVSLVLLAGAAGGLFLRRARRSLDEAVDRARADLARHRQNGADRPAFGAPSIDGNAWPTYWQAILQLEEIEAKRGESLHAVVRQLLEEEPLDVDRARNSVELCRQPLELVRKALAHESFHTPLEFGEQIDPSSIPSLRSLASLGSLLALDARLAAGRDDPASATTRALETVAFGQDVARLEFVVNHLAGTALQQSGLALLAGWIGEGQLPPEVIESLLRRLQLLEATRPSLRTALREERLLRSFALQEFLHKKKMDRWEQHLLVLQAPRLLESADRFHARLEAVSDAPYCDAVAVAGSVATAALQSGDLSSMLVRPDPRLFENYAILRAMAAGTLLASALAIHRHEEGQFPEELDELDTELLERIPNDPFDGDLFRYEVDEDGSSALVWSVGADLDDDGGRSVSMGFTGGEAGRIRLLTEQAARLMTGGFNLLMPPPDTGDLVFRIVAPRESGAR